MSLNVTCPHCNTEFALREARNDEAWRELVGLLASLPQPIVQPMLAYLDLFKPQNQRFVRSTTARKILAELQPMIKAQQVKRHQKTYDIDVMTWVNALNHLAFDTPPTIKLPLKGNGYLQSIIVSRAEKVEAIAEAKAIKTMSKASREGGMQAMTDLIPSALDQKPEPESKNKEKFEKVNTKTIDEIVAMAHDSLKGKAKKK